eukprot:s1564_g12.t1
MYDLNVAGVKRPCFIAICRWLQCWKMTCHLSLRRVKWQLHMMLAHARATLTSLSTFLEAWGEAADSLVASELATIYQLVKAKSDRILGKEKELQRSECMVAQVVGAAKARLRADVEDLLQISKQELRKEANLHKKRLEELFQKAQDEFRKAVTWRKEARALKGAVDLERDNHEKLQKKIQELVRREKALRQQHAEEKERWAQEKEQLEKQLALQNEVPAQEKTEKGMEAHAVRWVMSLANANTDSSRSSNLAVALHAIVCQA